MEASGADDATPLQAAALALATAEAAALLAADGQPAGPADPGAARARLAALPLPARIRCRTPEGFAFYALAPQAVAAAAARVPWDAPAARHRHPQHRHRASPPSSPPGSRPRAWRPRR